MTGQLRILVTGSRSWTDTQIVADAITAALPEDWHEWAALSPVLMHGMCPQGGADLIADQVWVGLLQHYDTGGLNPPERFDARDYESFKVRNQAMVDRGATVCLVFATSWASGTGQTARMARRAGIPTIDYGADTRAQARPVRVHEGQQVRT